MKAQLWKISTDHQGESTIVFKAPSSELAYVLKLNLMLEKTLDLTVTKEEVQ